MGVRSADPMHLITGKAAKRGGDGRSLEEIKVERLVEVERLAEDAAA